MDTKILGLTRKYEKFLLVHGTPTKHKRLKIQLETIGA